MYYPASCNFSHVLQVRSQFAKQPPSNEQTQKLLRLLHEVLLSNGQSDDARRVMIELMGTYTTENASQAREEAQRCIVASLADPNTFLLDHLLQVQSAVDHIYCPCVTRDICSS